MKWLLWTTTNIRYVNHATSTPPPSPSTPPPPHPPPDHHHDLHRCHCHHHSQRSILASESCVASPGSVHAIKVHVALHLQKRMSLVSVVRLALGTRYTLPQCHPNCVVQTEPPCSSSRVPSRFASACLIEHAARFVSQDKMEGMRVRDRSLELGGDFHNVVPPNQVRLSHSALPHTVPLR